jgi:hypothetical protein
MSDTNTPQSEQWISSIFPALQNEFLQIATDTSYLAQATSVIPELKNFVATASVSPLLPILPQA